jgi:hypothetical protein
MGGIYLEDVIDDRPVEGYAVCDGLSAGDER